MRNICVTIFISWIIAEWTPRAAVAQQPAAKSPVEATGTSIDIVDTLPLPGVGLPREEIAAPIQVGTSRDIRDSGALNLPDFLNQRLTDVHITETQGNPFQPDVNYRGYTASPVLGTPQGLSVY